jgi:hypothetical protein
VIHVVDFQYPSILTPFIALEARFVHNFFEKIDLPIMVA